MKTRESVKYLILLVVGMVLSFSETAQASKKEKSNYKYIRYVDPWIEANRARFFFFQSAKMPFGFMSLRPDDWAGGAWGSGYAKNKNYVSGFSHIHDWQIAAIQIMPTTGSVSKTDGCKGWESGINHDHETVQPGYHHLFLEKYDIDAELTATERVGMHRYTYRKGGKTEIILNLGGIAPDNPSFGEVRMKSSYFKKVSTDELEGWIDMRGVLSFSDSRVYFNIKFNKAFNGLNHFNGKDFFEKVEEGSGGSYNGATVTFDTIAQGEQIEIKVGISLTGTEGARLNRTTEIPDTTWDFDQVKTHAQDEWENMLSRIDVKGGTERQRIKFYTDLFHILCGRCLVSDVDGSYLDNTWNLNNGRGVVRHVPLKNNKPEFNMYNYDALWFTRWNLNTVLGLSYPEVYSEIIKSQLQMYTDGGLLPRGPVAGNYSLVMTSAPAISFITGAYNKGIRDFDTDLAWEAMSDAATVGGLYEKAGYEYLTWDGTNGAKEYMTLGYVPHNMPGGMYHNDGAGSTLEYSFQDFALANYAKKLNKRGINIAPLASTTASSERNNLHQSAQRAIDGRPPHSGIGEVGVEWESNGEYTPWIQLDFQEAHTITRIKLYDRISPHSNILEGKLTFSNGDEIRVGELPADGTIPLSIEVNKKGIKWVRFSVTSSVGTNIGLNDFEVWDDRDAYTYYLERSNNWKNLFDPNTKFIRPRGKDGSWMTPFDLLDPHGNSDRNFPANDFVEANSWQATFSVSHDLMGLARLMGGTRTMADTLDYAFREMVKDNFIGGYGVGYVSYGNQPGLSAAHVFNYIGYPWLSQYWVRQVKEHTYGPTDPDNGYGHHDEDQGQMGSMSVLMAIGLFQVTGGCTEKPIYELTSPIFDEITLKLSPEYYPGKEFKIITRNNSAKNCYIQKAELNEKNLENCWFYHKDYAKGGRLELWLGDKPNYKWGVKELPPSISK